VKAPHYLPLVTIALLLASLPIAALDGERRVFAYEAFDADGYWLASGKLTFSVDAWPAGEDAAIIALRTQDRIAPEQYLFTLESRVMQGSISDKKIELRPSVLSHSGYISLKGRFLNGPFSPFEGHWTRRHDPGRGPGVFRAWPITVPED